MPASRNELIERFFALQPTLKRSFNLRLPAAVQEQLGNATVHQLELLHRLQRCPLKMKELAREVAISETSATAIAERLVRQGLAQRHFDPTDRRIVMLGISDRGVDLLEQFHNARREMMAEAFAVLDDEQLRSFVEVLEILAAGPEPAQAGAA